MTLCLVTDRRRLGAACGLGAGEWADALRAQVFAAAAAGIDLVQLREPDLEAAALLRLARALVADTRHTATRIVVNDRLDVALAAGAAGVHLKERSFSVESVRALAPPGFMIGRSVHGQAIQAFAGNADYFVVGTVLPTVSKPTVACLGWEGLGEAVRAAAGRPVLAIGGIDLPSIPLVAASGAAGLAAIGAFIPGPGEGLSEFVQKRVTDMRLGFDSAHPVS
jgi:thiamine-phosphate diphosphorylase